MRLLKMKQNNLTQIDSNANVKKQLKQAKRRKKQLNKIRKDILTTMDWSNLQEIRNNEIIIKGKNTPEYHVMGVKVTPHDIFLDEPEVMANYIERWRLALNKLPFKVYWAFVTSPVDIDVYKSNLYQLFNDEEDSRLKQLLIDDFNKAQWFELTHRELEFFLFIRESNPRIMEKNMSDLFREVSAAGFAPKQLLKRDFLNYVSYLYNNSLINAAVFSKGVFQSLNDDYYIDNNTLLSKPIDTDDYLYNEPLDDIEFAQEEYLQKFEKSKYAPTAFMQTNDHMILGEEYMSAILITEMPQSYGVGFLCQYLNNPNIKLLMTTEITDLNITAAIKNDRNAKMDEYYKTTDPTRKTNLEQDLTNQQIMLDRVVRNNDRTLNTTILFLLCADNKEDLYQLRYDVLMKLNGAGFTTSSCRLMQEPVLRMCCPILLPGILPKQIMINYGIPLPAENVSGLYPFVFETLKDEEGCLFGEELSNGGVILFDDFAYKKKPWSVTHNHQRTNGNIAIVGKSGYGKTLAMDLLVRNDIRQKRNLVVIDPENKIFKLIKKYKGSTIRYGSKNNIINQLDLRPLSSDEDDTDPDYDSQKEYLEMWDTHNAINYVIGQINIVFSYLFKQYSDEEASLMGEVVRAAYKSKGIDPETTPTFKHLNMSDMPIYSDVKKELDLIYENEKIDYKKSIQEKLKIKLSRVCGEWGVYLDGHTSLKYDLNDKKMIAFGTKDLQNVSKELNSALSHIMYQYAWTLCIDNTDFSSFVIDEAHTNILNGEIASLTAQFVRRARKYNTCVKLATQEPRDFADPAILTHGKAIFNNCAYKLILHLDKDPSEDVAKLVTINDNEKNLINNFAIGQAILICGERRIPIKVLVTENEKSEFEDRR